MDMTKTNQHSPEGEHSYFSSSSGSQAQEFPIDLIKVEPHERGAPFFHKCKMCTYRTKSFAVMRSHLKRHKITRNSKSFDCLSVHLDQYKCTSCDYHTHFLVNINKHMTNYHCYEEVDTPNGKTVRWLLPDLMKTNWCDTNKNYNCDSCMFTTHSQIMYVAHYRNCPMNTFLIDKTPKKLGQQNRLLKHHKRKEKQNLATCVKQASKKKQTASSESEQHKQTDKGGLPRPKPQRQRLNSKQRFARPLYCCWKCPFKSFFVSGYVNHLHYKHDDIDIKWQRCDLCSYKSIFASHLNKHIFRMHKALTKCSMCPFRAKTQSAMRDHVLSKHGDRPREPLVAEPQPRRFGCAKCRFMGEERDELKEHILTHHVSTKTVMRFGCGLCKFVTIEETDLIEHVLGHVDPEGLQCVRCEMCDVKFRTREGLKVHIFDKHIL